LGPAATAKTSSHGSEQKGEQRVEQAFRKHCAEARKFGDKLHPMIKQLKRQHEVTDHERADNAGEQPRLLPHGQQPAPGMDGVRPQQQQQG
jgi:hypothetical protein